MFEQNYFRMEDVYEPSETTDSETGLVDNLYEFLVEKDEQEEEIQDTQEKRILNVAMLHLHLKAKNNVLHGQLLIHS